MKVLVGMALRQTTGFVESLLQLTDLDWAVWRFSTLSRRQKGLKVNIPYPGVAGPLPCPPVVPHSRTRVWHVDSQRLWVHPKPNPSHAGTEQVDGRKPF